MQSMKDAASDLRTIHAIVISGTFTGFDCIVSLSDIFMICGFVYGLLPARAYVTSELWECEGSRDSLQGPWSGMSVSVDEV